MESIRTSRGKIKDVLLDHAEDLLRQGMVNTAEGVVSAVEAGSISEEELRKIVVNGAIIEKREINVRRIKAFNSAIKGLFG